MEILTFDVVVNKIDTFKITREDLEQLIKDNKLDINIDNITKDDIDLIYGWIESGHIFGTHIINNTVTHYEVN